jgi:outer membrane protein OmpA-like peptidoglycan-associated protein
MERTASVRLAVAVVWIAIAVALAVAYRYFVSPQWKESIQGMPELTAEKWDALAPTDSISAPPLPFARGASALDDDGQRVLLSLAAQLKSAPQYFVRAIGQARSDGDTAVNERLALERARTVADFLVNHGISAKKVRASLEKPADGDGLQEVRFVIGEPR